MPPSPAIPFALIAVLLMLGGPGASAIAGEKHPVRRIRLVGPVERVAASDVSQLSRGIARLAAIDPEHPLGDGSNGQTLSLFGREDLIAATGRDYRATGCAPSTVTTDPLTEIGRRARQTSIVIVSESHERSEHRGFSAQIAQRLRAMGYDTLAMEALAPSMPGTPTRYLPTFVRQPGLPYFEDGDGHYLSEAGFGRLGRRAKALGYRLLPYEHIAGHPAAGTTDATDLTVAQEIAAREEGQARNLAAFVRDHPGAKLLIHVGYSHAGEVPTADGARWMAVRLKEKTGIDPLTISQTTCRGGGGAVRLSALPASEPPGMADLIVDHPAARFIRGRPAWRQRAGDRPVSIPRGLYPANGWHVVEARQVGEPVASVPMDRVAIRAGEDIALMLPPGRYRLRLIEVGPGRQAGS